MQLVENLESNTVPLNSRLWVSGSQMSFGHSNYI
jgi:hypothetical protein